MRMPLPILITLLLICSRPAFPFDVPAEDALPLPTPEQQAGAEESIRRLLHGRIDLDADDPVTVSRRLRELARGTADDPVAHFVLLRMAYDRARGSDILLASEIIDDGARRYRIDAQAMKADLFTSALQTQGDAPFSAVDLLDPALQLLRELLAADRIELAERLMPQISLVAGVSDDRAHIDKALRWTNLLHEWSEGAREAARASLRLLQHPADRDAHLAIGRYLAFIKGDWDNGLPGLAQGSDETLRALAEADLHTVGRDRARLEIADRWMELAARHHGLAQRRISERADAIYRSLYPVLTGLTRLKIEERLLSRPLLLFDTNEPPSGAWLEEHLRFHGNHGREGSGSWANMEVHEGRAFLVANRAGYVETRASFPPEGVERRQIEVELHSDLLRGVAFESEGRRMYLDRPEGVRFDGDRRPEVIRPIGSDRFHHFLIDIAPGEIALTLDGLPLGVMKIEGPASGPIILRGWEGHLRCRRLVVWALPGGDLASPLSLRTPGE